MSTGTPPADFLLQAEDLVIRLDADIALLRGAGDGSARRRIVEQLFRLAHTLKGAAATFELTVVARLAHEIENALDSYRRASHPAVAAASLCEALQNAVDTLSLHVRALTSGDDDEAARVESAADKAIRELHECTRTLALSAEISGAESVEYASEFAVVHLDDLPAEWRSAPPDAAALNHLRAAAIDNLNLFSLILDFDLGSFDEDYRRCESLLSGCGEIIASRPSPPSPAEQTPHIRFCVLYAARLEADVLTEALRDFRVTINRICVSGVDAADKPQAGDDESLPADGMPLASATGAELLRVPLNELDELIQLVAELRDTTLTRVAYITDNMNTTADNTADMLRSDFSSVQERLLRLRVTPLETVLREAARAGRVAARAREKDIVWEVAGGDVRLDKSFAEKLRTPLLHLVRNAVDHGIETPAERLAAGKPARGCIRVEAEARLGRVIVRVADDGRGIDPEHVRRAAVAEHVIPPDRRLGAEDHLRLIFRLGFSTAAPAESANALSGRGVGLSAAEREVRESGGELRVSSSPNNGTTFEVRLPTTLALLNVWVVREGGQRYCVPAEHVREVVQLDATDIDAARENGHLPLRANASAMPLVALSSLIAAGGDTRAIAVDRISVGAQALILRGVEDDIALAVEECEAAPRELLMRGLGVHGARWRGVVGAAALADGAVTLVLDVGELMNREKLPEARR